jgi:hypothetical protein
MDCPVPFRIRLGGQVKWTKFACAVALAIIVGCKKSDEIREYTLASSPPPAPTHRMLAAIVPEEQPAPAADDTDKASSTKTKTPPGPRAWFFKLVGPMAAVEKTAAAFDQFVDSIRTGKSERPQWTLPEGWTEDLAARAPDFGREATIRIDQDGEELELTVSKLAMPARGRESWTLGNINRWREQLKLPAIGRSELDEYTDEIKAGDETATKVDFRGVFSGGPMAGKLAGVHGGAGAAVASAAPRSKSTSARPDDAPTAPAKPLPFDAEVPAEWKPGQLNQFRVAAYNILAEDGSRAAEMTVTPLGPASGELKANVDRWRGEIKLSKSTTAELEEQTKTIEVDGQKADYVHLIGPDDASPREATLGVILRRPDLVWFFKLRGQADVVEREKSRFEEYVKSVRFK